MVLVASTRDALAIGVQSFRAPVNLEARPRKASRVVDDDDNG